MLLFFNIIVKNIWFNLKSFFTILQMYAVYSINVCEQSCNSSDDRQ